MPSSASYPASSRCPQGDAFFDAIAGDPLEQPGLLEGVEDTGAEQDGGGARGDDDRTGTAGQRAWGRGRMLGHGGRLGGKIYYTGDWEHLKVYVCQEGMRNESDPAAAIAALQYSQHTWLPTYDCTRGECAFAPDPDVHFRRPLVYAGLHSHANSPHTSPLNINFKQLLNFDGIYVADRFAAGGPVFVPRPNNTAWLPFAHEMHTAEAEQPGIAATLAWAAYKGNWGVPLSSPNFSISCLSANLTRAGSCDPRNPPVFILDRLLGGVGSAPEDMTWTAVLSPKRVSPELSEGITGPLVRRAAAAAWERELAAPLWDDREPLPGLGGLSLATLARDTSSLACPLSEDAHRTSLPSYLGGDPVLGARLRLFVGAATLAVLVAAAASALVVKCMPLILAPYHSHRPHHGHHHSHSHGGHQHHHSEAEGGQQYDEAGDHHGDDHEEGKPRPWSGGCGRLLLRYWFRRVCRAAACPTAALLPLLTWRGLVAVCQGAAWAAMALCCCCSKMRGRGTNSTSLAGRRRRRGLGPYLMGCATQPERRLLWLSLGIMSYSLGLILSAQGLLQTLHAMRNLLLRGLWAIAGLEGVFVGLLAAGGVVELSLMVAAVSLGPKPRSFLHVGEGSSHRGEQRSGGHSQAKRIEEDGIRGTLPSIAVTLPSTGLGGGGNVGGGKEALGRAGAYPYPHTIHFPSTAEVAATAVAATAAASAAAHAAAAAAANAAARVPWRTLALLCAVGYMEVAASLHLLGFGLALWVGVLGASEGCSAAVQGLYRVISFSPDVCLDLSVIGVPGPR
ncbi:hypothetical protein GPECTOR_90g545 [Gonium pectorale]|uniref:Uncharacterized protein n=1 Tax=Gonium pectorale TaxID=33097 RepID=A0A150G0U5_GONPE|nr:hypothetical protein GPECTOR_90g545 [Gonium pectorale]|eukprot:KXZ43458.1 hypothetical protein GPECTOR_90g545 [Gonium pectorale]